MSVLAKESVQAIADTIGINLKEDVALALVQDVEYRLREIINEATKFMRHAKRERLLADDINYALRVRDVEPLYGWSTTGTPSFKLITQGPQQLYYLEDHELDLEDIINAPLPPAPLDVTWTAHWLAIDGVQPAIVQNPTPAELQDRFRRPANGASTSDIGPPPQSLLNTGPQTEALVKNVLTRELQLYYEKVTEAVTSSSEELRKLAVESVAKDPGIQPLLPYLIQFVAEQITQNIRKLEITQSMMRLTRAILNNSNLFVEPYLHQLIPNILSCIVAKRLCDDPATEDHWSLRSYAAQLVSFICTRYGSTYQSLQPRVTKTLLRAFLDPLKSYRTNYGAIVGLSALGPEAVRVLLVPNVSAFYDRIKDDLEAMDEEGPRAVRKMEAEKCRDALVDVIAGHVRRDLEERRKSGQDVPDNDALLQELTGAYGALADSICNHMSVIANGIR
ncbi:hypothetical protein DFS34DRAFT_618796 [Phlyctochytrium arcticum]|nr:hypothetical protein DFS34DRAFT_618796 [Phlyctochytrium arcticum]